MHVHTCACLCAWIVQFLRKRNRLSYRRNKDLFQGNQGHDYTQETLQLPWPSRTWNEVPRCEDNSSYWATAACTETHLFISQRVLLTPPWDYESRQHSCPSSLYLSLVFRPGLSNSLLAISGCFSPKAGFQPLGVCHKVFATLQNVLISGWIHSLIGDNAVLFFFLSNRNCKTRKWPEVTWSSCVLMRNVLLCMLILLIIE